MKETEPLEDELLEDEQHISITVLNTGLGAQEVLTLFRGSEIYADLLIDNEDIMSGDAGKIEAAIGHLDIVIILSNLSDHDERELACKIAVISKKADVLTLVYNLVPFEYKDSGKKIGADLVKSSILKADLYLAVVEYEAFESLVTKAKNIRNAIEAIAKVLTRPRIICIDASDLKGAICTGKLAAFGIGMSSDIAIAVDEAFSGNDVDSINTSDISAVFITLTGGSLSVKDCALLGELIDFRIPENCVFIEGAVIEPSLNEMKQISVIFIGPELY